MKVESKEEFALFLDSNPNLIHFIGACAPLCLGVQECFTKLEYAHFLPGTPKNNEFRVRLLVWMQILWTVVSVPSSTFQIVEEIADECGLQIIKGVPTAVLKDAVECLVLPPDKDTVFTLSYKPDHPVYRKDVVLNQKMIEAEYEVIERIVAYYKNK